jgi:TolB protein
VLWDPESQVAKPLRESPQRDERWPVWSPDGASLVYAYRGGQPRAGIAQERLSDHRTRLLAVSGSADFFFRPGFAHDGLHLVAQRRGADGRGSSLWRLTPGQLPEPLTQDDAFYDMKPGFSRDGRTIVFSRRHAEGGPRHLARIAVEGGDVHPITSGERFDDHSGRASPTRDEIAFISDRNGNSDVFLVPLEGGAPAALTRTPVHEFAPRWSPDGERLVVTTFPEGGGDVSRIDAARIVVLDRRGEKLLEVEGAMPDWMPPWR